MCSQVFCAMKDVVEATDGVELVVDADLCIVPITSSSLSVKAIAAGMNARGWSLFSSPEPRPRGSIEVSVPTCGWWFCCTRRHTSLPSCERGLSTVE